MENIRRRRAARVFRNVAKALRWFAVAGALGLGSNAATAETPTHHTDPWGRPYPALCSPAALAAVKIPVVRVSQAFLDKATKAENRYGVFLPTGAMAVLDTVDGALLQGVKDHEACHWLMREATGNPEWHD